VVNQLVRNRRMTIVFSVNLRSTIIVQMMYLPVRSFKRKYTLPNNYSDEEG
jgi:hypothetical protein